MSNGDCEYLVIYIQTELHSADTELPLVVVSSHHQSPRCGV